VDARLQRQRRHRGRRVRIVEDPSDPAQPRPLGRAYGLLPEQRQELRQGILSLGDPGGRGRLARADFGIAGGSAWRPGVGR
jgi:hypothetical protein